MVSWFYLFSVILVCNSLSLGHAIPDDEVRVKRETQKHPQVAKPTTLPPDRQSIQEIADEQARRKPGPKTPIDEAHLTKFRKHAYYIEASYTEENTIVKAAPTHVSRPMVSTNLTASVEWTIMNSPPAGSTGFIALNRQDKEIVLVIRGSTSIADWVTDAEIKQEHGEKFCQGCRIHHGFYNGWTSMAVEARVMLKKLIEENPTYKLVIVGHSLGAAVATLAAFHIRGDEMFSKDKRESLELYAYASPRVGDSKFASWMSSQVASGFKAYRIWRSDDPVVRVPITLLKKHDWAHLQPGYEILGNAIAPKTTDIVKTSDDAPLWSPLTFAAHTTYFVPPTNHHGSTLLERLLSNIPTVKDIETLRGFTTTVKAAIGRRALMETEMDADDGFSWLW